MIDGRRVDMGLGAYPVVPLAKAWQKAFKNRATIADGRDPRSIKRRAKIPTFREAARRTHEGLRPTWTSEKHAEVWMQVLNRHAMPYLGALPSMSKARDHFRALDYWEMPEAVRIIRTGVSSLSATLCLLFLILTASRSNEARGATWSEIDLDAATWEIPGRRMKGGKTHRVPFSSLALEVLEEAMLLRNRSGLVFPSTTRPHSPMTSATPMKALKQIGLGKKTVAYGFRSSFRT
ncbi:MAG: integrase family protein [Gemmatimonadetes bacterium]|nr:integrase family protein [Gemmatimonadota bacterium]